MGENKWIETIKGYEWQLLNISPIWSRRPDKLLAVMVWVKDKTNGKS